MEKYAKIYVAGHRGLVGSGIVRKLRANGYDNLLLRTHGELDLADQKATESFFAAEKPDYVFLAAAKVGGILANNTYPAQFIHENLAIQANVIHAAYLNSVKRLLFLGSSCIYPRDCPQPIREEYLLTGPLEPTNRPYALAKIAGIEMCWSYNRQYGTRYLSVMPTNLYGPGDNYDLNGSHVIPALIQKFHSAKMSNDPAVAVWGSGTPLREFLYSEDMADACVFLMRAPEHAFCRMLDDYEHAPLLNIGSGIEVSIAQLATLVGRVVGYVGEIVYDRTKPDGTPRKLLDSRRLQDMGWQPTVDLERGLALAYRDLLENAGIIRQGIAASD